MQAAAEEALKMVELLLDQEDLVAEEMLETQLEIKDILVKMGSQVLVAAEELEIGLWVDTEVLELLF